MEHIVGIDLGTTNSEIALVIDSVPKIVPVNNAKMLPSCISRDAAGTVLIGQAARNQMAVYPENTILSVKRKMGTDVAIPFGDRSLSPEEASSMILRELVTLAQPQVPFPIQKAVITVPAYFNDDQRKATLNAGTLAGLEVVRIINEPTAATLAYNYDHEENRNVLVYDLGGGTFDVSVVVIENGVVEVKSSHGDTRLGGDDFDNLLLTRVAKEFSSKHSIDLLGDAESKYRLLAAVEKAKCFLSSNPYARIREEYIHGDLHLDIEISRYEYEEMITPLVEKTIACIHTALNDARFLPGAIDTVILAGGSTRTPLVTEMISKELGKTPEQIVDPDTIVALGAAVQAEVIAGGTPHSILVDITPHSFGTESLGERDGMPVTDLYVPVIKRNTPIPVCKSEVFYTVHDNQEAVDVKIYEGEEPVSTDNTFIGEFTVEGLGKKPQGNPIVLKLDLDGNGILTVTAEEKETGLSKTVTMRTGKKRRKSDPAASPVHDAVVYSKEEESFTNTGKHGSSKIREIPQNRHATEAVKLRQRAEKILDRLDEVDAKEIQNLLEQSQTALDNKDWETLTEINESISDMLFYLED